MPSATSNAPATSTIASSQAWAYCVESLWVDIETLAHAHGIHSRHFGLHRKLSARFPFAIYYRETPGRTEILAVLGLRRDPGRLPGELSARIG